MDVVSKHGAYMSTETISLIRDGEKGVWRRGGGGRGEGDYIPITTLSPPE